MEGIEAHYPDHSPAFRDQIAGIAKEFDLVPTGGSDFHGAISPHIKLGKGFGDLNVPDDVFDQLLARKP